jgi:hypothetical protein
MKNDQGKGHPGRRNRDDGPGSNLTTSETLLETMQRDLDAWAAAKAAIAKARDSTR